MGWIFGDAQPAVCGNGLVESGEQCDDGNATAGDGCPNDPDKTEPGSCGCGIADSSHGAACETGFPGVCSSGVYQCSGGARVCLAPEPAIEICGDGIDQDCDGQDLSCTGTIPLDNLSGTIRGGRITFEIGATLTLGGAGNGMDPETEEVVLEFNPRFVIPAGSFRFHPAVKNSRVPRLSTPPRWTFNGRIDGTVLTVEISDLGNRQFRIQTLGIDGNWCGLEDPVTLYLTIGDDSGSAVLASTTLHGFFFGCPR